MITLAHDFDFSLGRDADEYYRIRPSKFRQLRKEIRPEDVPASAIQYLTGRGIPEDVIRRYRIVAQTDHPEILVFPFYAPDGKTIQFVKYRNTQPREGQSKEWCEKDCKPILFGMDQCNLEDKTLIMTEGQIDTLSVVAAGYRNCVSVPTGKNGYSWVPHCWDWLQSFERLVIFGDHEHGEITLLEPMQSRFHGQVLHVRPEDYRECKDANDILRRYGSEGIRKCIERAERAIDPTIVPLSQVKMPDWDSIECMPTGFPALDRAIGGLYMGSLIVITGERGNGKSTLASQFSARAIREGRSIYAYSGELPAWQFKLWIDRQLSSGNGLEQKSINGRTDYVLTKGAEEAMNRYYDGRAYIYGVEDLASEDQTSEAASVLESIEKAVKQVGVSVVLVDNLMSAMDDPGQDLNWAQTQFVKRLSIIARRYNICVLLLAHPRKSGSEGRVISNDDIMGSGNITNLATTVISYGMPPNQFYEGGNRPDRVISVLKNRNFGDRLIGPDAIPTWFDPVTKRISCERGNFRWADDDAAEFVPVDPPDSELPF